ncbi:hypothetical protein EYF80_067883 [Liparis tanakae]|uniref:Uncharacterized protein n=1 Tax=Liparis tanakae TaxID=230148 RepID=A0A4Z2DZQ8_9TELE|nr:hypothetical protein EYF80_067883 [Liparis tanakae]
MTPLLSRSVRPPQEEREAEGHQPLRRGLLRSPPQTGRHHGPPAPPHAGDRLRGHRGRRAEPGRAARQQDGRVHRGERLGGRRGAEPGSRGAAGLQHDGLPARHAGQQAVLLLRLQR